MLLWWLKTEAAFDVWSIEHLIMWITLGYFAKIISDKIFEKEVVSDSLKLKVQFIIVLCFCFYWENLEHYIEVWLFWERVEDWFQGVEYWSNRLFFDNLMVVLGWFIYVKKERLLWFARVFSVVWLFFHIVVFPHSMYLHYLFG
jgi:hypothetical protein